MTEDELGIVACRLIYSLPETCTVTREHIMVILVTIIESMVES